MKTIKFNRKAYEREFRLLHGSYEKYALPLFQSALRKQIKAIAKRIRDNESAEYFGTAMNPEPMQIAYLKVYQYVGSEHAEFTYKWINRAAGKKSIAFFSELWRKAMASFYQTYGALRVQEVEDTTIREIQRLLAYTAIENMGPSQAATYIARELEKPEYTRTRAMRIARTESTTAANYGSQLAAESSDYECGKVWIPVIDKRTRPAHRAMATYPTIRLFDSFLVGKDRMQYPGEPGASAANVVNCRCTHATVPLEDENGLPILK